MAEIKVLTESRGFRPIKLELTIKSKEELRGFQQLYSKLRDTPEAILWNPDRDNPKEDQYYADDVIYQLAKVLTEKF